MKKSLLTILILVTFSFYAFSHPWKPSHYVIIDTDGGIDDMRAITLLLASPDVRVLTITTSSGALSRDNAYIKVRSLLNSFHHEGIEAGINRDDTHRSQNFPVALKTMWGDETGINPSLAPDYHDVINKVLTSESTPVTFICLGSLSTVDNLLRSPLVKKQVKEILWSADGLNDTKGVNYNFDDRSARNILSGNIHVTVIRSYGNEVFFDEALRNKLKEINSVYGEKISRFLNTESVRDHAFSLLATDEMLPVFLHYPGLFQTFKNGNNTEASPSEKLPLQESMVRILKGETVTRNQVIKGFPSDPGFYFEDMGPSVNEIINKYGIDEWTSGVIANELHRHLGTFAIIGVKMGIRAREYFNTGVDEFRATSFAGSVPPLSCLNDGIQVSTGATPGHGLLTVINPEVPVPEVEFTYMNRVIKLSLKKELAEKISNELKEINYVYGLDSNIYWELVRKNTINYWLMLDRHDIFDINEIR